MMQRDPLEACALDFSELCNHSSIHECERFVARRAHALALVLVLPVRAAFVRSRMVVSSKMQGACDVVTRIEPKAQCACPASSSLESSCPSTLPRCPEPPT